jgi:hypothetical protein
MELTAPLAAPLRLRRFGFVQKIVLAAILVTLADNLFSSSGSEPPSPSSPPRS